MFFPESHCFSSDYTKWELVRDRDIVVIETVKRLNILRLGYRKHQNKGHVFLLIKVNYKELESS